MMGPRWGPRCWNPTAGSVGLALRLSLFNALLHHLFDTGEVLELAVEAEEEEGGAGEGAMALRTLPGLRGRESPPVSCYRQSDRPEGALPVHRAKVHSGTGGQKGEERREPRGRLPSPRR